MKQFFNENEAIKYGLTESIVLEILRDRFWILGGAILFTPVTLFPYMKYCKPTEIENAIKTLLFHGKIAEVSGKYKLLSNKGRRGLF